MKKILFVGWGRAGKDEAAQFSELHLGLRYGGSTSWHAKEDIAKKLGIHPMTAWETRHNNRQFWKDYCDWLRRDDPCLLIRRALADGDVIAGIRDKVEFDAAVAEGLFDAIVWVDRDVPPDPTVTFTRDDVLAAGGSVIANNAALTDYHARLISFFRALDIPLRMSPYANALAATRL